MALTDNKVRIFKPTDKQYKLTDGNSMHLLGPPMVHDTGGCSTALAENKRGPDVSLADARARHYEARKLLANGVDPGDKKKSDKVEQ